MRIEPFRAAERFLPTKSGFCLAGHTALQGGGKGFPLSGRERTKQPPLRNARRGAADLSELLDRVIHRQGKDHYGQGPHGVIGDGAAEQSDGQRHDGQAAGRIDGHGIRAGSQHLKIAQLAAILVRLVGEESRYDQYHDIDYRSDPDIGTQEDAVQHPPADPQGDQGGTQDGQGPGALPIVQIPQNAQQHDHRNHHAQEGESGVVEGADHPGGTAQENAGGKHRPADPAALGLLAPDDAQDQTDHSHCRTRGHQIGQCGVACEKLIGGAVHIEAADDQQIDLRHAAGQKKLERVVHGLVPLYRLGFTDRIFGHIGQPPGCLFRK